MTFDPNLMPPIDDARLAQYEKLAESTEGDPDLLDAIGVLVIELKRYRQNAKDIYAVAEEKDHSKVHHLWDTEQKAKEDAVARANAYGRAMRILKGHLVLNPV